jgi:hypothetical protein
VEALIIGLIVVVAFVAASVLGGADSGPRIDDCPRRAI